MKTSLKRVALYGGTFDPVHAGHIKIGQRLLELFALDEFWFVPAHVAPHKRGRNIASPLHRYAMLALATQHEARLRINTIELDAPEKPYTVDTLTHLLRVEAAQEQRTDFFFVMGVDSWKDIRTWREWERLLQLTNHIVVTRPGYEFSAAHVTPLIRERIVDLRGLDQEQIRRTLDETSGTKIYVTDAVVMDVSATSIRRAVRSEGSFESLDCVSPSVADYIRKYELYRDEHERELFDQTTSPAH